MTDTLRDFVKDHIIPRLTQLEIEVMYLRRVTWPICQSLRETSQLSDTEMKKKVLELLDVDEVTLLLIEKARVSRRPLELSTGNLLQEELDKILPYCNGKPEL
jgi:hypothetical protein